MVKYCNCKNDKNKKYKGTENTPLGFGYHAGGYDEGKKKKGKNGEYYIVVKNKNGNKRWKKFTSRGGGNMDLPNIVKN
jgi:hypothetical protein